MVAMNRNDWAKIWGTAIIMVVALVMIAAF